MDRPSPADAPNPHEREDRRRAGVESPGEGRPEAAPRAKREPRIVSGGGRIRREALDPAAVHVVERLQQQGHEAYLVGGCVRDLLLGMEPKDFDVATDAPPNRIKRLFRNAFIIGRRFRLVHVRFPDGRVVETATFRADPTEGSEPFDLDPAAERAHGPIHDDNVFGNAEQDAFRRDFTVNALFYDPAADKVVDYVGGLEDLETRTLRAIGDPDRRLREDPVRMIRAVHFAARLGGKMEPNLEAAVGRCAGEIAKASRSRLYVELMKILGRGAARPTIRRLYELGVLAPWLPELVEFFDRPIEWPDKAGGTHEDAREGEPESVPGSHRTWNLLGAADAWGLAARGVPESLQLAVLCGPWLLDTWERGPRRAHDFGFHLEETFRPLALRMSIPRKASYELREILWMLGRLKQPPDQKRRVRSLVERGIFPEALAYYGLELRARDHDLAPVEKWREWADEVWASHRDRPTSRSPEFAPEGDEGGGEHRSEDRGADDRVADSDDHVPSARTRDAGDRGPSYLISPPQEASRGGESLPRAREDGPGSERPWFEQPLGRRGFRGGRGRGGERGRGGDGGRGRGRGRGREDVPPGAPSAASPSHAAPREDRPAERARAPEREHPPAERERPAPTRAPMAAPAPTPSPARVPLAPAPPAQSAPAHKSAAEKAPGRPFGSGLA